MHNNMTSRVDGSTPLFDGTRDLERRENAASGRWFNLENINSGSLHDVRFKKYVKTVPTYATQVPFDYEVDTLEGRHFGKAGTFLAVGQEGEMYPIDEGIFKSTYRLDE